MQPSPRFQGNRKESEVVLLDVFEILVGSVGDAFASGFVADDDAVLVHLEHGDGPHLRDGSFDGSLECACFVVSVAEDEYFACSHHGSDADGECGGGHVFGFSSEEA